MVSNEQIQAKWNYKNDQLNGLNKMVENGEIKSIKKYQNGQFIDSLDFIFLTLTYLPTSYL